MDDDDYKVTPFSITVTKTSSYVKVMMVKLNGCFYLINDDELLKKYTDVWNKVSNSIKKEFLTNPSAIKTF